METWFHWTDWRNELKPVTIKKASEHTLTLSDGMRVHKRAHGSIYFQSEKEGLTWLTNRTSEMVTSLRSKLRTAEEQLGRYSNRLKEL